jgi:hypothetical protein
VVELFGTIEREVGPLHAVVFNSGANVPFSITETTARIYRKVWEIAALAGFLTGRAAAKVMLSRGQGTIIFTGPAASLRGRANFSAFASAKFAPPRPGPEHGSRARPAGHSPRPPDYRRRHRYCIYLRHIPRALPA